MKKIKTLFSTPKKTLATVACIVAILALLSSGAVFAASAIAESSAIGAENAKNFAFADAGVDPVSASHVKTEFDYEQGQFVYEVEFVAGNVEYEYWIKASNGAVVKKQVEIIAQDGSNVTATAEITLDGAKEIALADAGLAVTDVTFTKAKLDVDDGVSVYDIEFFAENAEYEYEINAVTGVIYSKSKETFATTDPVPSAIPDQTATESQTVSQAAQEPDEATPAAQPAGNSQTGQPAQTPANEKISVDTAKNNALTDAGVSASAVTFTKVKLDHDDGIFVYDIEFYTTGHEYEYEIDASTGAILDKEVEALETAPKQQDTGSYIGVEKAKSIALGHAGVSDVTYTKAKLENEDGQAVYEIEFRKDGAEYEYTIRATDGTILEYDLERDD